MPGSLKKDTVAGAAATERPDLSGYWCQVKHENFETFLKVRSAPIDTAQACRPLVSVQSTAAVVACGVGRQT